MSTNKYDISYMKMALEWSSNSHCKRSKVGALIVKDNVIISDGINGTPSKFDNCCEDSEGNTKFYVLHAECNAIAKLARGTSSSVGSTMYVTMSPCRDCAKLIYQTGIKKVFFLEEYRDVSGLDFLKEAGVEVEKIELT